MNGQPSSNLEADYRRVVGQPAATRFLPGTGVEIVREVPRGTPPRHVLFDFDGTLSLIREGWPEVMVPMMVEVLQATGTAEPPEELRRLVCEFIMELNGKQTIYQMIRLAEEVRRRGGTPQEPLVYKQMYHDRLMERIAARREALRSGATRAGGRCWCPTRCELLDELQRRGAAALPGQRHRRAVRRARRSGCWGSTATSARTSTARSTTTGTFSKAMVIERILRENASRRARRCWASATATWRSRTSRPSAARPWPWPATRPAAAAGPTLETRPAASASAPTW